MCLSKDIALTNNGGDNYEKSNENHIENLTRASDTVSSISYHNDNLQSDYAQKE